MKITTKQKKLLVSSLVALILALTGVLLSWLGGEETYTPVYINGSYEVERVIDGDTIVITYQDIEETVRFIGVDAPEVNRIPEHTTCGARMAKEFVESKVLGQTVELKADPSQGDRDKYGRLLAYVFLEDGTDLGEVLIQRGFANEYTYYPNERRYASRDKYLDVANYARTRQLGVWSDDGCNKLTI